MTETQPISPSRLIDRAMRILSQRDHSKAELRRKLQQPVLRPAGAGQPEPVQVTDEQLDALVSWCEENGWLDDVRFTERFIASRSRKGYGPLRIRQELGQKGIARDDIACAMQECEIDWQQQAAEQAERKFGTPLPTEWKAKAKVLRYLQAKGFAMEHIQSVFTNFDN